MNKAQRTRRHIIEKTAPLFNMNGFDGTSLAELCRVTGLTKGALYGNFADKEELAIEAFRYTISKMRSYGSRSMMSRTSYKQKLDALLNFFLTSVLNPPVRGGCPLLNTAVEADDRRTSMRKTVVAELEKSVNSMTKLLDRGKQSGEFKKDFNSREMAMMFFCSIEGAIMFSRVAGSAEAMAIVTKSIRSIIESICTGNIRNNRPIT
jgi:TetR/AcrR family transcriptional regulator, transcriptional repressor for nem operon